MASSNRYRAIRLYKELYRLGRDYPDASYDFIGKLRRAFKKNSHLSEQTEIEKAFALGEYIKKDLVYCYQRLLRCIRSQSIDIYGVHTFPNLAHEFL